MFGSLFLQSASMVFTDIGTDHGGGPAFDPVVKFVNRYRAKPTAPVERHLHELRHVRAADRPQPRRWCPCFRGAGMTVKYVEARDGHNWEDWRDRLRDGLSWLFPGPQKFVYE